MSSPSSFWGFKLPARRPPVEQTPSGDDGASTSAQPAQGSGFGETVHTPAAYRPTPSRDDDASTSAQPAQGSGYS
jgi:hypothetical protein